MPADLITLTIEKLAGLGDGVAMHNSERIFVPYTLPGDIVLARIVHETKEAISAIPEEILTPGEGRIAPVCKHFGICGGCALQHFAAPLYTNFKQQTANEAVRKAGFDPALVASLVRLPAASRRRVEIKVAAGKLGFYAERSHLLVDIEECKVLEPELFALVMRLKSQLVKIPGLTGVQINGVDHGYDVVLNLSGNDKIHLAKDDSILRLSVKARDTLRVLFEVVPPSITLGGVSVEVPPGAFLQASRQAQMLMTERVLEATKEADNIVDLFAGIGTYSFPLAARANVTAVEGDMAMVRAMQAAATKYDLGARLRADRRDLFRQPLSAAALKRYDAIVINPPRSGAKEQTACIAAAKVKKLVMISCNPATFTRDARTLKEAGYRLESALPIDQFVYSAHLEIIAEFVL